MSWEKVWMYNFQFNKNHIKNHDVALFMARTVVEGQN